MAGAVPCFKWSHSQLELQVKRLLVIAIVLLIPLLSQAASKTFLVTLEIRARIIYILNEDADPDEAAAFLETLSSQAVSFATLSLGDIPEGSSLVRFVEASVVAVNEQQGRVSVITFSERLPNPDSTQYIVGGYIASNSGGASGNYEGSATVQALFQ